MRTSEEGRKFITRHEGLRLKPYKDVAGFWTIGIGHLIDLENEQDLLDPNGITIEEADQLLANDLYNTEHYVGTLVDVDLKQNEFDALVSLIFNIGPGNFQGSTVRSRINGGDTIDNISEAWQRWNKAGRPLKVYPGLVKRREEEVELYRSGTYQKKNTYLANSSSGSRVGSNNNPFPLS
jgi:lysozyme